MKKLQLLAAVVLLSVGVAHAENPLLPRWANLFDAFSHGARVHFLDNVESSFYYDVRNEENRGAVTTSFLDYGFLSARAGIASPDFDQFAKEKGSPLVGGSASLDKFVRLAYPGISDFVYRITPKTAHQLMEKAWIGFAYHYDFTREQSGYGVLAGLQF